MKHKIRTEINDDYTRAAAKQIRKGNLTNYTEDGSFIYKHLTQEEYEKAIKEGNNEPFVMDELNLEADYCHHE